MTISKHLKSRLDRIDWDFAGSLSDSRFSALHWHPARLPSQVAATFIGLLSAPGDTVLDPFVGSGTSVVEAQRLGRKSIGVDLNPVSILITKAKTLPVSSKTVGDVINILKTDAEDLLSRPLLGSDRTPEPPGSVQKKWYTAIVLGELSILWHAIQGYRAASKVLAEMAFSAILLPVCRETRHWGYVCDNSMPQTDHAGEVLYEYLRALGRLAAAYQERDDCRSSLEQQRITRVQLRLADAREALWKLPKDTIQLLLTSPPYFGVSDYVKSQRLTMEWLELEIEPVRLEEIGARSKRHRNTALEDYLRDMVKVFEAARPALRKGATCVIVLGESTRRALYIKRFHQELTRLGYELAYSTERNISTQRRQYGSIETENITLAIAR